MKEYIKLFSSFFRIGITTFGGGYAMLPAMKKEISDNNGWVTEEEIIDLYAISQMTPGIIAVNTATFVGFKVKGITGAVIATLGIVMPSLLIITVIASFLMSMKDNETFNNALSGIRIGVSALILSAVAGIWKKTIKSKTAYIIFLIVLITSLLTGITPPLLIIFAAAYSIIAYFSGGRK